MARLRPISPKKVALELIGLRQNLKREGVVLTPERDRILSMAIHWCERLSEMMKIMKDEKLDREAEAFLRGKA